ncbi:MAG: hypothetical protein PUA93_03990 [Eubacteriales bacterium]|nr:hypothetical protein [Eubacteriales bacterium]
MTDRRINQGDKKEDDGTPLSVGAMRHPLCLDITTLFNVFQARVEE